MKRLLQFLYVFFLQVFKGIHSFFAADFVYTLIMYRVFVESNCIFHSPLSASVLKIWLVCVRERGNSSLHLKIFHSKYHYF